MTRHRSIRTLLFALIVSLGIVFLSSQSVEPAGAQNGDVRFAVLGDFGSGSSNQQAVADMIDAQNVEFIATVGDNVYSAENADPATAIANKVTAFYGDWMNDGTFYPLLGNHDWGDPGVPLLSCPGDSNSCTGAWFDAFDLPGNERYYSVRQGAVEVFVYSDYYLDPDFNWQDRPNSPMTLWLRDGLANSTASWKIVLMHFPKHKSPTGTPERQDLDFAAWGADAVIAGHTHFYERLETEGIPYFVNGTGGASLSGIPGTLHPDSKKILSTYGAMIVDADDSEITFSFRNTAGAALDSYTLQSDDGGNPGGNNGELGTWEWGSVPVGGGGYVTGIVVHPQDADVVYARTDVGGAYRWDTANDEWISISETVSYQDRNFWGIESIAVDPNDVNTVYMAAGERPNGCGCDILKSTDRGDNWTRANLNVKMGGNQFGRWYGERLAVDPNNSNVVYFASRYDGVWRSTSAASPGSFSKINFGPFDTTAIDGEGRLSFAAIDPTVVGNGRSQRMYVGVVGVGVYRSTNGGTSWSLMGNSPTNSRQGVVGSGGRLYVSHETGVARLNPGSTTFTDITPPGGAREFSGIDVSPSDGRNVVVAERNEGSAGNRVYRSPDYGNSGTWQRTDVNNSAIDDDPATWQEGQDWSWATADIAISPDDARTVWLTDWFNIWRTPLISVPTRTWELHEVGHEELVVHDLISPSSGAPLLSGAADNAGFRHPDPLTTMPTTKLYETQDIETLDVSNDGQTIVAASSRNYGSAVGDAKVSTNNGQTWTSLPQPFAAAEGGEIAVSSDGRYVVWMPWNSTAYSLDLNDVAGGWTAGSFPNALAGNIVHGRWAPKAILSADPNTANRFYLFDYRNDRLFQSNDGGRNWYLKATVPVNSTDWSIQSIRGVPSKAGEVWISSSNDGLYRVAAGAPSGQRIGSVDTVIAFGFGASAPGSQTPSLYLYGRVNGSGYGLFMSDDLAATWTEISANTDITFSKQPKVVIGDNQTYGRVYIGTGGRGIYYGDASGDVPAGPSFTCRVDAGEVSWTDAGAPRYWIYRSTDGGGSYQWLGRSLGGTQFTDAAPVVGATYQVHYQGIPRIPCTVIAEPPAGAVFSCRVDAGEVSWTDAGEPKYWIYRSTDGGGSYQWLGRSLGGTQFTDAAPVVGATYQVHYQGIPREECAIVAEPPAGQVFSCSVSGATITWTDMGQPKYWIYRSTDGGASYSWLGRSIGGTQFVDPSPVAGARYQVHFAGIPREFCSGIG